MAKRGKKDYTLLEYMLLSFVPFTGANLDLVFDRGKFFREIEAKMDAPKNSVRCTFYRARKKGYLKEVERKGCLRPELTRKGKIKIIKHLIKDKEKEWDGLWRVIVFDIPEKKRKERKFLRDNLRILKFIPLQKSVWISPFDHGKELEMVLEELEIKDFIHYFMAKSITDEKRIKKIFLL